MLPARTRTVPGTARLSGFVQPIGYILAALALVMGAVGVAASRRVFIEDELAR